MKKVTGGVEIEPIDCADWRTKAWDICWACCTSVNSYDDCVKPSNCGPLTEIEVH